MYSGVLLGSLCIVLGWMVFGDCGVLVIFGVFELGLLGFVAWGFWCLGACLFLVWGFGFLEIWYLGDLPTVECFWWVGVFAWFWWFWLDFVLVYKLIVVCDLCFVSALDWCGVVDLGWGLVRLELFCVFGYDLVLLYYLVWLFSFLIDYFVCCLWRLWICLLGFGLILVCL